MIDHARIETLKSEIGSEDFKEVVGLFFEESEDVLESLEAHPTARAEQFHFLKGSALYIGLAEFSELCAKLEENPAGYDAATFRAGFELSKSALLDYVR